MSLGTRISSMRGYNRLTQEQLGGLVGVTKQTISNWEHDYRMPDADDLRRLCGTLGCTADYLLELSDNPREHRKIGW